jgi:hypothetical protein
VGGSRCCLGFDSVGAKQLKAGSVRGSEVKNGSLGVGELKRSARTSLRGQTGGTGPKGVVSVSAVGGGTGVKFNQDIDACAIVSSIGRDGSFAPAGESNADEFVTNGQPKDTVVVTPYNSAGAGAAQAVHVAVFC